MVMVYRHLTSEHAVSTSLLAIKGDFTRLYDRYYKDLSTTLGS